MNGTSAVAQRMVNAQNGFIENVTSQFGFSQDEALIILNVFIKNKVVKLNLGIGRYNLVHVIYWDKEVMKNALEMA